MPRVVLPLQIWLLISHLLTLTLPLVAVIGTGALAFDLRKQTEEDLFHQSTLLRVYIEAALREPEGGGLARIAPEISEVLAEARASTLAGYRLVDHEGKVVATSTGLGVGDDLSRDPEVIEALAGRPHSTVRPRNPGRTLDQPLGSASRRSAERVFVATPLYAPGGNTANPDSPHGEHLVGALLLSRTPRDSLQTLYQMGWPLWAGASLAILVTLALSWASGHYLSRSLKSLARASHRIAGGATDAELELLPALHSHVLETRRLADAMTTMQGRLQERVRYIREFAGNVSHEFKTPVSALRGIVELLRDDPEMPAPQQHRFLDNALHDLDRLSRLVGGLLQLARAEEGGGRELCQLDELVSKVDLGAVPVEGGAGWVRANREQLERVLLNLVGNARVHGGTPIRLRLWSAPAEVGVDVEDAGPGVPAEHIDRIFDRFYTTNRAGGGTGLGLALVRAVLLAHSGSVTVTSRPGETVFRVSLPRAQPPPGASR